MWISFSNKAALKQLRSSRLSSQIISTMQATITGLRWLEYIMSSPKTSNISTVLITMVGQAVGSALVQILKQECKSTLKAKRAATETMSLFQSVEEAV